MVSTQVCLMALVASPLALSCGEQSTSSNASPRPSARAVANLQPASSLAASNEALPPLTDGLEVLDATLTLNPNGATPLAALVELAAPVLTTATLQVRGAESWDVSFESPATQHRLPLVGLKPDHHYDVTVRLTSEDGVRVFESSTLSVDTGPLPEGFPEFTVARSLPELTTPGDTMFPVRMSGDYQVIVNPEGDVIWYYVPQGPTWDIRQLPDGRLLLLDDGAVKVMDLLGNVSLYLEPAPEDADYHHEVFLGSQGTLWTMGNRVVSAEAFPADYELSQLVTVDVTDDVLIELDPLGGVLQRIHLRDVLDPQRIGYDSLSPHVELGTPVDWAHANAIIEVDDGDNLIVSCRHQDAVFKISRDGTELQWILANHDNWSDSFRPYLLEPVGPELRWPYHQHAPEVTPSGNLLIFDNGNHRASPSDGTVPVSDAEAASRVVEYRVNEAAMTVEQVWEHTYDDAHFSVVVGDVDLLPGTNSVLATYGALARIGNVPSDAMGRGRLQGRIVEINRSEGDAVAFELEIYASDPAGHGYFVYRAERIESIR